MTPPPCPWWLCFGLALAALGSRPSGSPAQESAPPTPLTITVRPGARQSFDGFGASIGNWGRDYGKLAPAERAELADLLWRDLRMRTLRLWINLDEFAPDADPAHRTIADFRARYVDSGVIADATRRGVVHLLLAPDAAPAHLRAPRPGGPHDHAIPTAHLADYADLIADLIARVRDETGVLLTATGLQNEPNDLDQITPEQMPTLIRALRAALDRRDLRAVAIIAPESANVDATFTAAADAIERDPVAWAALDGLASHSYGMASTAEAARRVAAGSNDDGPNRKSYWMTEASDNGPEGPGDALRAASLAGRFLNDMNHRVTHWVHFLGFEVADPRDDATRIIRYQTRPFRRTTFQKHGHYRQLAATFDPGARFRASSSSLEGGMTWTYGRKPRVTLAAAQNPDGSWGVGLVNFTSPQFRDDPAEPNSSTNGQPAQRTRVTVQIPELAERNSLPARLHRRGANREGATEEAAVIQRGAITVDLDPLDLVTLRTEPVPVPVPVPASANRPNPRQP